MIVYILDIHLNCFISCLVNRKMENTKESPVSAAVIVSSNKITNQENTIQLHTVHTPPGDTYKISMCSTYSQDTVDKTELCNVHAACCVIWAWDDGEVGVMP